jgi:hypothetical protein
MPGAGKHLLTTGAVAGLPLLVWAAVEAGQAPAGPPAPGRADPRLLAGAVLVGAGLVATCVGALWPNIDHLRPPSRLGWPLTGPSDVAEPVPAAPTRGWAHSLLSCLAWSWLVAQVAGLGFRALGQPPSQAAAAGTGVAVLFGAGYLLHLAQDARTPGGVPFWWGTAPLLRAAWLLLQLTLWPLWFVVPGLNPFARPDVEVELEVEPPPGVTSEPPPPPPRGGPDGPGGAWTGPLPEAVHCARCGTGHHPAASFCQVCGAALRPPTRVAPSASSESRGAPPARVQVVPFPEDGDARQRG